MSAPTNAEVVCSLCKQVIRDAEHFQFSEARVAHDLIDDCIAATRTATARECATENTELRRVNGELRAALEQIAKQKDDIRVGGPGCACPGCIATRTLGMDAGRPDEKEG